MNDIRDLLPGGKMRERTFQLKARRDVGVAWTEPQFVECKQCGRRTTRQIWAKSFFRLPQLRLPPAHRRLLSTQPCAGPWQFPGAG